MTTSLRLTILLSLLALLAVSSPGQSPQYSQSSPGAAYPYVLPPQMSPLPFPVQNPHGPANTAPDAVPFTASGEKPQAEQDDDKLAAQEIAARRALDNGVYRFGQDLFDFRQISRNAGEGGISDDYQLGVGDELRVFTFGSAAFEAAVRVDGRGEIVVPKLGSIHVGGLDLAAAKDMLQRRVNKDFTNTKVDIQVSKLREVRVFVLGDVYRPGAYLVPSLSSLVNILSQAGGPTPQGSYRDIRVLRGDRVIYSLDLYPLRAEGRGRLNVSLQSGDTVFVPLTGPSVLVRGEFMRMEGLSERKDQVKNSSRENNPTANLILDQAKVMSVELKAGEKAWDVVRLMGGIRPNAFTTFLTLARRDGSGILHVLNIPTDEATLKRTELFPEDALQALSQKFRTENVVDLEGYVRVPGTFAFTQGKRVADLLKELGQTLPDSYMERGQITRTHVDESMELIVFNLGKAMAGEPKDNPLLQPRDKITLFKMEAMRRKEFVTILGPVTRPGRKPWLNGMRASDLLFSAGLPLQNANEYVAELSHIREGKLVAAQRLELKPLLSTESSSPVDLKDNAANPLLEPFDQLNLYQVPNATPHAIITLSGQVNRPGAYELDRQGITLKEIIERAGGLTPEAMVRGGILLRKSGIEESEEMQAADPRNKGISEILERLNETRRQPSTGQLLKSPVLHGIAISRLNRIVVDFPSLLAGDSNAQIEFIDGDEVIIPRITETAWVVGETSSPYSIFRIKEGVTVGDLIQRAGGFTRNADKKNIRLLKCDGHILDGWRLMSQKVEPGDAVLIPQRIIRDTTWQENLSALTPLAILIDTLKR